MRGNTQREVKIIGKWKKLESDIGISGRIIGGFKEILCQWILAIILVFLFGQKDKFVYDIILWPC